MTNGLIVIKKGSKVLAAYRTWSDGGISADAKSFCAMARKIFTSGDALAEAANLFSCDKNIEKLDNVESLGKFYVCTGKNKGDVFPAYTYEIDQKSGAMTIYWFGQRYYAFKKSDLQYFDLLCREDSRINLAFGVVADTLELDFRLSAVSFSVMMKRGLSVDEIETAVQQGLDKWRAIVTGGHIVDSSHDISSGAFKKKVELYDGKGALVSFFEFCFSREYRGDGYSVYLQTPMARIFCYDAKSKTAAEKRLPKLLSQETFLSQLYPLAEFFRVEQSFLDRFSEFKKSDKNTQLNRYEDFYDLMSRDSIAAFGKFSNDDFDAIFPRSHFSVERERAAIMRRLYEYKTYTLDGKRI